MKEVNIQDSNLRGMFYFLSSLYPKKVFFAILTGIIGGIAYSVVIPLIMMSIATHENTLIQYEQSEKLVLSGVEIAQPGFFYGFLFLCGFILLMRTLSQVSFNNVAINSSSHLRQFISSKISQLPVSALEKIGKGRLTVAFTIDLPRIMNGAAAFPQVLISLASIFGIMIFLLFLNLDVFIIVNVLLVACFLIYRIPVQFGRTYLKSSRESYENIQEGFTGAIEGAKELKLHREKRQEFSQQAIKEHEADFIKKQTKGQTFIIAANNVGGQMTLFIIGFVTFILAGYTALSDEVLLSTTMAVLYLSAPVNTIMNLITPMTLGVVSLNKLQVLLKEMPVEPSGNLENIDTFNEIHLEDISYYYEEKDKFSVKSIDLTLRAGEVTVITGGNGSGKSTLSKIISCHYLPKEGRIYFGDSLIDENNRDTARQYISAIFTDFHLFKTLLDFSDNKIELANHYLEKLKLQDKVSIVDGAFSTTQLSDGQRKRLALLVSYLEDRKICIFDEWTADQDPYFRELFYTEILPDLKRKNKIIVIVSHDDRYFDLADRLVRMEYGQITLITTPNKEAVA